MMVIYRPIKKWLIPLLAVILGLSIGLSFFPSSQEAHYNSWLKLLDDVSLDDYQVESTYYFDDEIALISEGFWSEDISKYSMSIPVSDDTQFSFDIYLEGEQLFIDSGGVWRQTTSSHTFINEMSPLDHPFAWTKDILAEADEIHYEKQGEITTFVAVFHSFTNYDFLGYLLIDQLETTVTMTFDKNEAQSLLINMKPEKHGKVGIFEKYPEVLKYDLHFFILVDQEFPSIPDIAREAEMLD
ncbi:hypothetical protein RJD24_17855 [Bacillaceae bacterium IKA-2]|nr:hypothetical protein RJD24_17855 [Bacillaceae bacterium IKA-2]